MAESWDIKLDRADELLGDLGAAIREMRASGDFKAMTDSTGNERAVRLVLRAVVPARISALIGDFIHNARSALDTIALATCEAGKGGPLTEDEEEDIQFPITLTPEKWEAALKRKPLRYASPEHVDYIRFRQPWYHLVQIEGLDEDDRRQSIEHEPLSTLRRLSAIDKHRRAHVTVWHPTTKRRGQAPTRPQGPFPHELPRAAVA